MQNKLNPITFYQQNQSYGHPNRLNDSYINIVIRGNIFSIQTQGERGIQEKSDHLGITSKMDIRTHGKI